MFLGWAAALSLAIWLYLALGRGFFWMVPRHLRRETEVPKPHSSVAVVVPARNEADVIGKAVTSLLLQDYPLPVQIFVVDDGSNDGTGDFAKKAAAEYRGPHRLTVLQGKPLAPGWTGKLWALSQGIERASQLQPEYLLFTDSDIEHSARTISEMVCIAEAAGYSLVSYMVKLACDSVPERALIPAFVFFFLQLYPPAWIRSSSFKTAGAAGGCLLIRRDSLTSIGGLESVRNAIIDDCTLAHAVKQSGGRIWLGMTGESASVRPYGSFGEIGRMISRSAFSQLRHSNGLLFLTIAGLALTYVAPIIALLSTNRTTQVLGLAAWLLMAAIYLPMIRFYNRSWIWSLSLPFVAMFYASATIQSATQYWKGSGGTWKGRVQDPSDR